MCKSCGKPGQYVALSRKKRLNMGNMEYAYMVGVIVLGGWGCLFSKHVSRLVMLSTAGSRLFGRWVGFVEIRKIVPQKPIDVYIQQAWHGHDSHVSIGA